jgi:CubicO group peptidase (beta-lactamase class C family)
MLLAALMALASCASAPNADPASAEPADQLLRLVQRHHICAAAVVVIRQRELQQATTAAGCDPALVVKGDSVFQAASLSKPVFAYAVLKLVDQGRMALDAPVLRYLPHGYRHAFDPSQHGAPAAADEVTDPRLLDVTVRMLLQHTAGLPNWASGPLHFKSTPGTRWIYSGEGYVLLQQAVEAVMGQPLDEVMQEQVFTPLGMAHSGYRWTPQIAGRLLPGTKVNGSPRKVIELRRPVAAFSLYTTVDDYGLFLTALLRDEATLARISDSPVDVDTSLNLRWGLGWGIEQAGEDVHLWQWGNNPGYRAFVIAFPRSGDGLVMLTNSDGGLKLAEPLVRAALPAQHKVFQSSFVTSGVMEVLCEVLRVCP